MTRRPLSPLADVRRLLLATLALGIAGTALELVFIGHFESFQQMIPGVLLGVGFGVTIWHALRPCVATVRALQATMVLFVLSGAVGVVLHYQGNHEFELEMYPSMAGLELVRETLTGATPVLAPGSMTLLGLVGLAHAHRHPRLLAVERAPFSEEAVE